MHPTTPSIFPEPAASSTRRTAAGVKADRRSPAGLGLDTGEDRRTLATAGTANTQVTFIPITCIMPMRARLLTAQSLVHVNSQPFVRQLVTRWISPVVRQAHLLRGQARDIGPLGVLHKGSGSGNLVVGSCRAP